ncbi:septation protein IspZ [Novosphingobium sp. BL-8H]|uniref:septation protein IspZ n=1 Tax=Novosphingobium sp. BL-8H TaxID=3127640 RepID=UPI003756FCDB
MKDLFGAARGILFDLAGTLVFFALHAWTGSLIPALLLGLAVALGQFGWRLWHRQRIDALQWIGLVVVLSGAGATLLTHDIRFMLAKPSVVYVLIGCAMLQRGWMDRYMPPRAREYVPDLIVISGYVWSGLMFVSAALNLVLALRYSVVAWASAMAIWSMAIKSLLFMVQFTLLKGIGKRRARRQMRNAATAALGQSF